MKEPTKQIFSMAGHFEIRVTQDKYGEVIEIRTSKESSWDEILFSAYLQANTTRKHK